MMIKTKATKVESEKIWYDRHLFQETKESDTHDRRGGEKILVLLDKAITYRRIFIEFVVGMPIVLASVPLPREY